MAGGKRRRGATGSALSEGEALSILKRTLGRRAVATVPLGIGDDACVLRTPGEGLCWTIDASDEGAHYLLEWMSPEQIAHKSIHAAVSDLAAMGTAPAALLCHVTLSPRIDAQFFERFTKGQARVAQELGCPIAGGNLSSGPRFSVVTTALGLPLGGRKKGQKISVLTRDGARVGDEIWLLGRVGLARLGLLLLRRGSRAGRGAEAEALAAFRSPRALIREGISLLGRASSCMDVSDGLRRDLQTLSQASRVRLVIDAEKLRALWPKRLCALAERLGEDPLSSMLEGGEDYALLATGASEDRPRGAVVIGYVERGRGAFLDEGSGRTPLTGGFEHGA